MILSQLGWILASKLGLKSAVPLDTFPNCVQEASKRRPRAPKSVPRARQERPRAPQERSRAPQERPRAPEKRARATNTCFRGAQGAIRDTFLCISSFFGVFLCFLCFSAFLCVFTCFSVFFLCFYTCLCIFVRFSVFSYIIFLCFPALFWIESILGSSCLRVQKFALPGEI